MEDEILVFIQASADLQHALTIYEKHENNKFHICVVNVYLIYNFITELKLKNTRIEFYNYININYKNPFTYNLSKNKFKEIWENNFKYKSYSKIYFFSRFYDWFTIGLVCKFLLTNNTPVVYYEHYDDTSIKNDIKYPILKLKYYKHLIESRIVSYISSAKFTSRYFTRYLEFKYWEYNILKENISKPIINNNYLYKLKTVNNNVIIFLSPSEIEMIKQSSVNLIREIITELKKTNNNVILKGHPRLGTPTELTSEFDEIIPNYIPSEFIDYHNVNLVIGIISTALNFASHNSKIKVISIIKLIDFKDEDKKCFFYNYLNELSSNKISFIENKNIIYES